MIRSILANFSARLLQQVMMFVILLLTTHHLGAPIRGEISIIQLSITMIHLVSDIVGGPALVYLVPRAKIKMLLFSGWIWALFTSTVVGMLMIQYEIIPSTYSREVLVAGFLLALNSINMNILLGQERIRAYNLLLFLQGVIMLGGMSVGIFLLDQKDATPYLLACYGAYGLCFLIGLLLVLSKKHEPKLKENRPLLFVMFATGFFTQIASLTHQWSIRQNYFTIEEVLHDNKGSVGIYATAVALAEAILLFSASVAAVLMARLANEKQTQLSRNYTLRLSKLSIGVTALGVLFFAILPPEFYSWLLGKDFTGVHKIFLTLVPGVMLVSFGTVYGHYFSGSGKHHMNFFSGLFGLTLTFIFAHWLISKMGITGAGWAGSIAYGGMALFIFAAFMLVGNKNSGEWKELLPSRSDFAALKNLFRKENRDTE